MGIYSKFCNDYFKDYIDTSRNLNKRFSEVIFDKIALNALVTHTIMTLTIILI